MAKSTVSMERHECDASCEKYADVEQGADAPPGWFTGDAARADDDGKAADKRTWTACGPRHIRGAIENVTGEAEDGERSDPGAREGSAAEVADDPADTDAEPTETLASA